MPRYATQNVCDLGAGKRFGRINEIGEHYDKQDLDVLALVEVRSYAVLALLTLLLPSLPHVLYKPGLIGPAGGLVTFSSRPIDPIEGIEYLPFSLNPFRVGRGFGKAAQAWRSQNADGENVYGITTHPSCNPHADWERKSTFTRALARQFRALIGLVCQVTEYAEQVEDKPLLVVLGDFNAPPGSQMYEQLVEDCNLTDPFNEEPTICYRGVACRLDGIFYRSQKPRTVQTFHVFRGRTASMGRLPGQTEYVSDHEGLILVLS